MIPGRPSVIMPGVYQVPTVGAKITAIQGPEGVVLVDTGGRGSWPLVAAGLRRLGISPGQVRLVVLTHYHPDHSGDLKRLVEATSAPVAVHRSEAGFISGKELAPNPFANPVMAGLVHPVLPLLYGAPVPVEYPLEDGDILPFSEEMRVIHTPGHTTGSICLYLPARRLLITGDALQYRFRRLAPPATLVTHDPQQARESLGKLLEIDFQCICFSHFTALRHEARDALAQLVRRINGESTGSKGE